MDSIPPSTRSSLLIDLEMGKRIEVEALQGAAVRRAAKHGIPDADHLDAVCRAEAVGGWAGAEAGVTNRKASENRRRSVTYDARKRRNTET